MINLGLLLNAGGQGITPSPTQAYMWLTLARDALVEGQGKELELARVQKKMEEIAGLLSEDDLSKAASMVENWRTQRLAG